MALNLAPEALLRRPDRPTWLNWPRWPGWANLPREARDTLFQLCVVAWTILPHAPQLPMWCLVLATLMLAWRAQLALANSALPKRWVIGGVMLVATTATSLTHGTLFGKEAGVTMLVVLLALKTLELRARRDAMVVFFLGFFVVLTHFLYSQTLFTAVAMLVSVAGFLTALVLAHMPVGRPSLASAGRIALKAAMLGSPIMLALFLLFPRIGPLWGLPQDAQGKTGLSGTLSLGGLAEVANDDAIAMRIRFLGTVPPPTAMYFRGPVLGGFDGREWTRESVLSDMWPLAAAQLEVRGNPVRYEMTLEPSRLTVLPLLETAPPNAAPQIEGYVPHLQADLQWTLDRPVSERLRFQAQAWPQFRHGPRQPEARLREHLQLPAGYNPRTVKWANDLRERLGGLAATEAHIMRAVLEHVRTAGYTYTLQPGLYGRDAVDEFWLDRRQGFCEHFSVAFVVVMRALGVPARIVTGYQGTDPQPVDGYHIVRQRNAHAWAEYWQRGDGWVRVDPTAAVAPERVMQGRSLAPTTDRMQQALLNVNPELAGQLRRWMELSNNRWNQWVMNYSRAQQFRLLENLGFEAPDWVDLAYVLIGLLVAVCLGALGWALYDRLRQDPWHRLQRRIAQRLARLQVAVAPHHPPRERANRVRLALGSAGEALASELEALERLRYAPGAKRKPDAQWWRHFQAAAAQCRPDLR